MGNMPTKIESAQNRHVKELAALSTRKGRSARNTFLVEGARAVAEVAAAGAVITRLIVEEGRLDEDTISPLARDCLGRGIPVLDVPRSILKKICGMETPQGLAAEVSRPETLKLEACAFTGPAVLACEIRDPRNAGLLARTAAASGASPVIYSSGSVDPFHPVAVQTAMGTIFRVDVITDVAIADAVAAAKGAGLEIVATTVAGGVPAADWLRGGPEKFLLLLGGEANGLDPQSMALADTAVTLPLHNEVESLNVAVSAGVLLYAALLR